MLPEADHVVAHCTARVLNDDGSVSGTVFRVDPDGVSVSWLEHRSHPEPRIRAVQQCITNGGRTLKPSHKLAIFNVASIKECGRLFGKQLAVTSSPIPAWNYLCHSSIQGLTSNDDDNAVLELIATEVIAIEAVVL